MSHKLEEWINKMV